MRGPVSRILSGRDICLCGLPEGLDGPSSDAFLLGLAPARVYRSDPVARAVGGLLHHRFTLTCANSKSPPSAVYSLWHFPEVAPAGIAPVACPVESGLSSSALGASQARMRPSGPL